MRAQTYDYIIVGGGSAGCVLASRLTEDPQCRVLLLEAGGWDRDPRLHMPLAWGDVFTRRLYDWMYDTEPQATLHGRRLPAHRGKGIGGSSSINAMAYVRGHRSDYDRWAASGLPGWSYADVLPYFKRQEDWEGGADPWRGEGGPLRVRFSRFRDPLIDAYVEAGLAAGYGWTDDINGASQEGFGRYQATIGAGRRSSAATAYLRPALARANLTVQVGARVERLLFDAHRAAGVAYTQDARSFHAWAEAEILLCGGTYNSPQLLMLSGMGPPDALRSHGIVVRTPLTGVGENLQDHISAPVHFQRRGPGVFHRTMRLDRLTWAVACAWLMGRGPATDLPGGISAFIRSRDDLDAPDVQFLMSAAPLASARPYLAPLRAPYADGFTMRAVVLRPRSRGRVTLRSADPARSPVIDPCFLSDPADLTDLRTAVRRLLAVTDQPALAPLIETELAPGRANRDDAALDEHIRRTLITVHHPLGTCRMAPDDDPNGVVDAALRVRGVEGLRVVDASVMPDLVGGNINAAVLMLAEKAADLVRGRVASAPAVDRTL